MGRASARSAPPGHRRRSRANAPGEAGRAREEQPAIASSQCWPVSMKTSSWRARIAGRRAAALMRLRTRPDDADQPHVRLGGHRPVALDRHADPASDHARRQRQVAQPVPPVEDDCQVREP